MAEKVINYLTENFLNCSMCYNQFKKPKILPCYHTFCLKCLQDYVKVQQFEDNLPCPLCNAISSIPEHDVNNFPGDFRVQNIIDQMKAQKDAEVKIFDQNDETYQKECGGCENLTHLVSYCTECKFWLCKICTKCHLKIIKNHNLENNETIVNNCKLESEKCHENFMKLKENMDKKKSLLEDENNRILREIKEIKEKIHEKSQLAHDLITEQTRCLEIETDELYKDDKKQINELLSVYGTTWADRMFEMFEKIKLSNDGQSSQVLLKNVTEILTDKTQTFDKLEERKWNFRTLQYVDNISVLEKSPFIILNKDIKVTIKKYEESLELPIDILDTVEIMKTKFQEKFGKLRCDFHLYFNGLRMESQKLWTDYIVIGKDRVEIDFHYMSRNDFTSDTDYRNYVKNATKIGDKIKLFRPSHIGESPRVGDTGVVTSLGDNRISANWSRTGLNCNEVFLKDVELIQ